MYPSELYLGPTVQFRSAARRMDQDLYNKILQIGWSYDESVCWWCWGKASTKVTAGCYGADSEGWFDPWALLQVQNCLCKKNKNKIITFNNWLILQAFKLSAQHGGVEYVQGEVTQVLALQEWIFHYLCQVSFKICTNILSRQNRSCPQSSDSGEQKLRRKSFISTHIQPLGRQGGKFTHGIASS